MTIFLKVQELNGVGKLVEISIISNYYFATFLTKFREI
jgi:hypothetical protein